MPFKIPNFHGPFLSVKWLQGEQCTWTCRDRKHYRGIMRCLPGEWGLPFLSFQGAGPLRGTHRARHAVLTKSGKRRDPFASDGSLNLTHWNTRVGWVKGAIRGGDCLKGEEGECVDLAEIPTPKRPRVHQEEIQRENKAHFRSLSTGTASTEGTELFPAPPPP